MTTRSSLNKGVTALIQASLPPPSSLMKLLQNKKKSCNHPPLLLQVRNPQKSSYPTLKRGLPYTSFYWSTDKGICSFKNNGNTEFCNNVLMVPLSTHACPRRMLDVPYSCSDCMVFNIFWTPSFQSFTKSVQLAVPGAHRKNLSEKYMKERKYLTALWNIWPWKTGLERQGCRDLLGHQV